MPEMLWTVLGDKFLKGKNYYVVCKCKCGVIKDVRTNTLGVDSFGCRWCRCSRSSYGLSDTQIGNIWSGMKQRCYDKNQKSYKDYGGRGITVCDEWRISSQKFILWAATHGYKDGLSLDRKNNDGPYSPENCHFIPKYLQNKNQRSNIRIIVDGKDMILKDWCREKNLNYDVVRLRIYRGYTPLQAISKPTKTPFKERLKRKKWKKATWD